MNKLTFITGTFLSLILSLFIFTGCSKDDGEIVDEKKAFTELSASEQQSAIIEGFKKFLGKKYKLRSMSTYGNDGDIDTKYPSECQQKVTITLPGEINTGKYIVQDAEDNSCALSLDDDLKMDLKQYGFTNYKMGIPFFTVMTTTVEGGITHSADMFFYVDENQEINVDEKYLTLFEPRPEDLKEVQGNYGKVAAKFIRRYTFEKIN
ncbi:hypothetical protein [Sphingobacterium kitahiroshimense]|uniref:hypothetical protein n=1 Tax=Sphingobacterium kitahiroshimense TaxID=470446 RepID=UPI00320A761B